MADTQAETQTPIAFEVHAEIEIDAPPDVVWRSLIEDVGSWWPHTFQDGSRISLEPWIGGRFMEEWDGGGALYAVVTHLIAQTRLTTSGHMGMPGARQYVKTYELEPFGERTIVRTTASTLGDISDERRENYRRGGLELLDALKAHAEHRAA
jgi:uncharacterized protein YndB with AHSA1/START domain